MDKETIALVEDVRKSLVDFGKKQTGSALKKTRKITSQIIWEPGPYLNELDDILSSSATKEEAVMRVRSLVRSSEEAALKSMTLLPDDTGHHIVQSRTGGDALTELPYSRTGPIIQGLSEKHQMKFGNTVGKGGNLPAEMSLSNYAHKADDRATGLERQSGIGKNPNKLTTAHPKGTAGSANLKGVDLTSDAAIAADLDVKVTEQIKAARTAAATDAPRQQAVREIVPGAYKGNVQDIATTKTLITPKLETNKSAILDAYRMLTKIPGGKALGGLIPGVGFAFDAADAKEKTETASKPDATVLDKVQAGIAQTTAATSLIPEPISQAVNIVGGMANSAIDIFRSNVHRQLIKARRPLSNY
jgi:hypothetical protein